MVDKGHYVYILACADMTLYTGYAVDPYERTAAHNAKKGAKYTRSRLPVSLVYYEQMPDRSSALRREIEIKGFTRDEKLMLISASGATEIFAGGDGTPPLQD